MAGSTAILYDPEDEALFLSRKWHISDSGRKYLPRGVLFMQPQAQKGYKAYYIRPVVNGKRVFKGYFSSVQEAKEAYISLVQGGLMS